MYNSTCSYYFYQFHLVIGLASFMCNIHGTNKPWRINTRKKCWTNRFFPLVWFSYHLLLACINILFMQLNELCRNCRRRLNLFVWFMIIVVYLLTYGYKTYILYIFPIISNAYLEGTWDLIFIRFCMVSSILPFSFQTPNFVYFYVRRPNVTGRWAVHC